MSGPRVDGLSDDAGLTPLLDDNPVRPALDDGIALECRPTRRRLPSRA